MTPQEKNAILQFMGVTYGHSHKLDKNIVGDSNFVKPISTAVRQTFEQVLKTESKEQTFNDTSNYISQSSDIAQSSDCAISPTPQTNYVNYSDDSSLVTNDSTIIEQLKQINTQLIHISKSLEKLTLNTDVRTTKKAKSKVEE